MTSTFQTYVTALRIERTVPPQTIERSSTMSSTSSSGVAAPPQPTQPTSTNKVKNNQLVLAQARVEYARLKVELAAAKIALLEVENQIVQKENLNNMEKKASNCDTSTREINQELEITAAQIPISAVEASPQIISTKKPETLSQWKSSEKPFRAPGSSKPLTTVSQQISSNMRNSEVRFERLHTACKALDRLRHLPKSADTPRDICNFAQRVSDIITELKNNPNYLYNPEITKLACEKMPSTLRYRWFNFVDAYLEEEPDLLKLAKFLDREAKPRGGHFVEFKDFRSNTRASQYQREPERLFTTQDSNVPVWRKCLICNTPGHVVINCEKFKSAGIQERWEMVKAVPLCYRCLHYRTKMHMCRGKRCKIDECTVYHHELLHGPASTVEKTAVTANDTTNSVQTYLKMLKVRVSGPTGNVETWALLADGSNITLIDDSIVEAVGAKGPIDPINLEAIAGTKLSFPQSRRISITLQGQTDERHCVEMRTIKGLKLASQEVKADDLEACLHLRSLRDQLTMDCVTPKILIGQDNVDLLLPQEFREGRKGQPVASRTPLGWVLHGTQALKTE